MTRDSPHTPPAPPLRVLYVIDSLAPGGAETSLVAMAPGLRHHGISLHVLCLGRRSDLAAQLERGGATVHLNTAGSGRIANVRAVLGAARMVRPDLIHTTLFEADIAGRVAASLLRVPVSSSLVGDTYSSSHYAGHSRVKVHAARAIDALTAQGVSRFHAVSPSIAASVPPRLRVPIDHVDVIVRGRDASIFRSRTTAARASARRAQGLDPGAPIVLSVARLEPEKGLDLLICAMEMVHMHRPDSILLIAGKGGSAESALRRAASQSQADVRFLGHQDQVIPWLTAADVFCLPSEREGFSGALLEALAVGTPVVASDIAPNRLALEHGSLGALVRRDPHDLARGIMEVLDSPMAAAERATRGRRHFEEHFSLEVVVPKMVAFFRAASGAP